ncbi:Disease resistance protein RGA5 [Camellia lanceoleosa]|uniref:Disease resistance protein RGA5 n=1 Tax=Camellia lanceoleosa TaxID=1840588 RepID=A0ACC0IA33_9ERIC|nr:Disease resistance protein RGA5 [Camellia lanceoleosa]
MTSSACPLSSVLLMLRKKMTRNSKFDSNKSVMLLMALKMLLTNSSFHLAHHHGNGFREFLRKIPRFIKTLKTHHQLASEVLRIKSRVVNISQGRQRYQERYGIPEGSRSTIVNNSWYDCPGDALLLEETKLVGIEKPKTRLIGSLIKGVDVWDAVKSVLPDKNCHSRVILTTRLSDIASSTCCSETDGNVYTLMPLSAEESWMLFCNKTFRGNLFPPHLKEISHKFFKKFNGLLLAIVAISGALAIKDQSKIDEWEMIYRNLGAELEDNGSLESMQKALSLSYNYLPDYLKTSFLYLSIFPEGQQIMCSKVIRLWIAEGFVNATENMTTEEVANNHLNELFNRSLLQVAQRFAYRRP